MRRFSATLLCAALLVTVALAATFGDELHSAGTGLGDGTQIARGVFWSTAYSDKLAENYIEYTPGGNIKPVVVYGSKVTNYGKFTTMAQLLEDRGMHVIGGINGDYYNTANYVPLGLVIADGIIRSAEQDYAAVGFRADGTAFVGWPGIKLNATIGDAYLPVEVFNKVRIEGGFALFNSDFGPTTLNTKSGRDIVMHLTEGSMRFDSELRFIVDDVLESKGAIAIPEGSYILSLSDKADEWRQSAFDTLEIGDEIRVSVSVDDKRWLEAEYAVGTYRRLLDKGELGPNLDNTRGPRTAIGIRPDGSFLLYTIDGRQPGLSAGASMTQVAQRLLELGCTEAGLMDGGGSTSLSALYIGQDSISQINSPSDGAQRSVSNYIMLVTAEQANGVPARLGVSPYDVMLLQGASATFTVRAADSAGYPAPLNALSHSLSAGLGSYDPATGVYTSDWGEGSAKTDTLSFTDGSAEGFATVTVVYEPHEIRVYNESNWSQVRALELKWGQSVALAAVASYNRTNLIGGDGLFIWGLENLSGIEGLTFDGYGNLTAGYEDSEYTLTVTSGGDAVATVPVSVLWNNPFSDVKRTDWFYEPVKRAYNAG